MEQTDVLMLGQDSLCALLRSPQFSGNRGVGAGLPLSAENPEDAQRVQQLNSRKVNEGKETKETKGKEEEKKQVFG